VIVLDTSAMVEFLVGADPLAERVRAAVTGEKLAAPHVIDVECAAAMRGLVRGGKLPPAEAERALGLLGNLRLERYGHVPLLGRIWQLRHNMWPYDAAYVALAELLDAELLTLDGKLATIPGALCAVRNLRGES
jgi:predicted nucleic acid-binding protein